MSMITYPLPLPKDLYEEVKDIAGETGLSNADVMRQSMRLGFLQLRAASGRVTNIKPLPKKQLDKVYADREENMESIRQMIAAQPLDAD